MSIQWGAFSEVGLAVAQENRGARLSSRGIRSLSPAEGHAALEPLFAQPRPQVAVLRFDARQLVESHPAAVFTALAELVAEDARAPAAARQLCDGLRQAAPTERMELLSRHVRTQLGTVLRLESSRIDERAPFTALGMDSLMSLELRNRLEASLGIRLSATILFTYPNTAALARQLLSLLDLDAAPANDAARTDERTRREREIEAEISGLSTDELIDALAREVQDN
jgi:acyl carrier protein